MKPGSHISDPSFRWAVVATGLMASVLVGSAAMAEVLGGDAVHGQTLFQQRCGLCHTAGPEDGDGGQGPPLAGVVGRRAGAAPGFNYTAALKESGKIWTPMALDRFLAAPGRDVPGTAMPISTPSAKDRADLIAYLATVKAPTPK
jgi:cytochrome c2